MVTDVNQTHSGDHFVIDANMESLYCTPVTNIMFISVIPQFVF